MKPRKLAKLWPRGAPFFPPKERCRPSCTWSSQFDKSELSKPKSSQATSFLKIFEGSSPLQWPSGWCPSSFARHQELDSACLSASSSCTPPHAHCVSVRTSGPPIPKHSVQHGDSVFLLLLFLILRIHNLPSITGQHILRPTDGCLGIPLPPDTIPNTPPNHHHYNATKSTPIALLLPCLPHHTHVSASLSTLPFEAGIVPLFVSLGPVRLRFPSISIGPSTGSHLVSLPHGWAKGSLLKDRLRSKIFFSLLSIQDMCWERKRSQQSALDTVVLSFGIRAWLKSKSDSF